MKAGKGGGWAGRGGELSPGREKGAGILGKRPWLRGSGKGSLGAGRPRRENMSWVAPEAVCLELIISSDRARGGGGGGGVTCISVGTVVHRPPWSWMMTGVTVCCLEVQYYYCSRSISQPGSAHMMVWLGLETATTSQSCGAQVKTEDTPSPHWSQHSDFLRVLQPPTD